MLFRSLEYAAGAAPNVLRPGQTTSLAIWVWPTGMRQKIPPAILKSRGADILGGVEISCWLGCLEVGSLSLLVMKERDIEMWRTEVHKVGLQFGPC